MLLERAGGGRHGLDLPGQQVVERRPGAAIVDVVHLDAGGGAEHLHRHVQRAVGAGRAIRNSARPRLHVIDEVLHGLPRRGGRHGQQRRVGQHAGDGPQLAHLVEGRAFLQTRRGRQHRQRRQRHEQRVAVGLRLGGGRVADGAAGTAAVLDHDRRLEHALQGVGHRTRGEVGLPAGRKGHDHGDIALGPAVLGDHGRRGKARQGRGEGQAGDALQDGTAIAAMAVARHEMLLPWLRSRACRRTWSFLGARRDYSRFRASRECGRRAGAHRGASRRLSVGMVQKIGAPARNGLEQLRDITFEQEGADGDRRNAISRLAEATNAHRPPSLPKRALGPTQRDINDVGAAGVGWADGSDLVPRDGFGHQSAIQNATLVNREDDGIGTGAAAETVHEKADARQPCKAEPFHEGG